MALPEIRPPAEEQLERFIKATFSLDAEGKIHFVEAVTGGERIENIHAPLSHLFMLMLQWNNLLPPDDRGASNASTQSQIELAQKADGRGTFYVLTPFASSPDGMFDALELAKSVGLDREAAAEFEVQIAAMQNVMLLGAISAPSIRLFVQSLERRGFRGTTTVVDLSPVPINLAQNIHGIVPLTNSSTINFAISDATTDLPERLGVNQFELICTDILGIYLTHELYQWATTNIDTLLEHGGYFLTREMIEPENTVEGREQTVGIKSNTEQQLLDFIHRFFPTANYSLSEIQEFMANRWPQTTRRYHALEYVAENSLGGEWLLDITTAPAADSPRLFVTTLYKKS